LNFIIFTIELILKSPYSEIPKLRLMIVADTTAFIKLDVHMDINPGIETTIMHYIFHYSLWFVACPDPSYWSYTAYNRGFITLLLANAVMNEIRCE
jgi:hypothetical protein